MVYLIKIILLRKWSYWIIKIFFFFLLVEIFIFNMGKFVLFLMNDWKIFVYL